MRQTYLVTYDICDAKRLREVYRIMKGYGDHLQYSVFRCDLSRIDRVNVEVRLDDVINSAEDQVLFIDLGPEAGRAKTCICAIGRAYIPVSSGPVIV